MLRKSVLAVPLSLAVALVPVLFKAPDQARATPLTSPVPAVRTLEVATGATITGSPVANVVADFASADSASGRGVELQALQNGAWVKVDASTMGADGAAKFGTVAASGTSYRAVAGQYTYTQKVKVKVVKKVKVKKATKKHKAKYKKKTVTKTVKKTITFAPATTPELLVNWNLARDWQFDGSPADAEWTQRNIGVFGRKCSANRTENASLAGGFATLSVTAETDPTNIAASRAAGCPTSQATVFRNGGVSTYGRFTARTGVLVTRVKFPKQLGTIGGIWIRQADGTEIDMVESYGLGKGFTNVYHLNGVEHKLYKGNIKDPAWWDEYHVFSVEWSTQRIVFRVDGDVTAQTNAATPAGDYYVVMTNGSTDWLLDRLDVAKLPNTMSVDWVRLWTP